MNGSNVWGSFGTFPCSNGIFMRKINKLHEVENNTGSCTNKEIRKFEMTLGNYFFSQGDFCNFLICILQTFVNYDSFEGKVLLL